MHIQLLFILRTQSNGPKKAAISSESRQMPMFNGVPYREEKRKTYVSLVLMVARFGPMWSHMVSDGMYDNVRVFEHFFAAFRCLADWIGGFMH